MIFPEHVRQSLLRWPAFHQTVAGPEAEIVLRDLERDRVSFLACRQEDGSLRILSAWRPDHPNVVEVSEPTAFQCAQSILAGRGVQFSYDLQRTQARRPA